MLNNLPGQVHAPVNGSEAFNNGTPDDNVSLKRSTEGGLYPPSICLWYLTSLWRSSRGAPQFSLTISNDNGYSADATDFFQTSAPPLEHWNFTYYEDLFAQDAKTPVVVNVAAKAYRKVGGGSGESGKSTPGFPSFLNGSTHLTSIASARSLRARQLHRHFVLLQWPDYNRTLDRA